MTNAPLTPSSEEERALDEATWHLVGPVARDFKLDEGVLDQAFDLGHGIVLARRPDWFGSEAIPTWLGYFERQRAENAALVLLAECRAGLRGPGPKQQEDDKSKLRSAQVAVWIASGIRLRYDVTIVVEPVGSDGKRRFKSWTVLPADLARMDVEQVLTHAHLAEARDLLHVLLELTEGEHRGPLWVALRMGALASDQYHADIAFTLMWVGLEALFGPDSSGETIHQLAERIAFFLESDASAARALYRAVKKAYGRRSKVIHGRADGLLKKDTEREHEESRQDFFQTAEWLRRAIRRIALDPEIRPVFAGAGRDQYLAELPFGRTPVAGAEGKAD